MIFALVAKRALEPGSKLATTRWVGEWVVSEGCAGFGADAACGRWASCSTRLVRSRPGVFDTTATLVNLSCDVVLLDATSAYWELEA